MDSKTYEQGGVFPQYPTKKALRDAAKAGVPFTLSSTSMFGGFSGSVRDLPENMVFTVVGPDPHTKRNWYANVEKKNGKVTVS